MNNKDSNFNQALWLGIGQLLTFAISFVTAPILARYFDKVEYGTYKQILYVYASLQGVFTMGLPMVFAYFIPKLNKGQQKTLVNKLTYVFVFIGFIFSLTLYLSSDLIAKLLNNQELSVGLKIFSPFPLFTLPAMGVEGIYTAIRRTKSIAIYHIFSKAMMFLCIVLPVTCFNTGYKEAIIGWGIASFLTFLIAMYMKKKPYVDVDAEKISNMYKDIFSYSLPLVGSFMAGFFITSADQFFVSRYFGTQEFAIFSNGCFNIPIIGMIAASCKSILLPLFSKAATNNKFDDILVTYSNSVNKSATLILPVILFCICFSTEIISVIFGEEYSVSGRYFRVFIIRDIFEIFPYFAVLMGLGYTKFYMNIHWFGAIFIWLIDVIIIKIGVNPIGVVVVSTLFQISLRISTFIYVYRKNKIIFLHRKTLLYLSKMIIHCTIALFTIVLINEFIMIENNILRLFTNVFLFYLLIVISGRSIKINYLESFITLYHSIKK